MAVNFAKNQEEIIGAWKEVVDSKDVEKWALFGYEGSTNNIKLMRTGLNGLNELVQELNCSLIQYAFCRVISQDLGINKLVLINWQGDSAPLSRKGLCASHIGDVTNYFKGCSQTVTIRNDEEATPEYLLSQIAKTTSSRVQVSGANQQHPTSRIISSAKVATTTAASPQTSSSQTIGSSYKKTDINSELGADRKSFWQRQEEEEKQRLSDEKKRAAERQAQFERERKCREEAEAKKLAETVKQRDLVIEAARQADQNAPSNPVNNAKSHQASDDDERVGRRSELLRLERNQETQSLISKGLIKDKRAIFEQASQQSQQQAAAAAAAKVPRRTSATKISQRLNTYQSACAQEVPPPNSSAKAVTNDKITNGVEQDSQIDSEPVRIEKVESKLENFKITNDEKEPAQVVTQQLSQELAVSDQPKNGLSDLPPDGDLSNGPIKDEPLDQAPNKQQIVKQQQQPQPEDPKVDANGATPESNGNLGISAKALYDYQAADNTEISFDPDDIIGFIDKVDSGWWHGCVATGRFKGLRGLFPANYVEELKPV